MKYVVKVHAEIRDLDTKKTYLSIEFTDRENTIRKAILPMSHRQQPELVTAELLDAGASLPTKPKEADELVQRALLRTPAKAYSVTRTTGWADDVFVLPDRTVGKSDENIRFNRQPGEDMPPHGRHAGFLKDWKAGLTAACKTSDILCFAVAAGFAGPLLRFLPDREGAVFALLGPTSTGKTLALLSATSVIGRAVRSQMHTLDVSARGLEELAAEHNGLTLALDEAARFGSRQQDTEAVFQQLAHVLPSGTGRRRSKAVATTLHHLKWSVLTLVTGEMSVPSLGVEANGERVRLVGVPVPDAVGGGIFNRVKGTGHLANERRRQLAAQVEETIATHYGKPLRTFLQYVESKLVAVDMRVGSLVDEFVIKSRATSVFERRLAAKFGLIYAAAKIAVDAAVAPWESARAAEAILHLYHEARGAIETPEARIQRFTSLIHANLEDADRFPRLRKGEKVPADAEGRPWGYHKVIDGKAVVALESGFVKAAIGPQHFRALANALCDAGLALRSANGKPTRQLAIAGTDGRLRYLCVLVDRLHKHVG